MGYNDDVIWVLVVYFVNSGSEANELATLMVRLYAVVLTEEYCWVKFILLLIQIHTEESFGSDPTGYARDVQDHIDYGTSGKVAGFISETFSDIVRKAGGGCTADEVQSGFGRTGSHY
ncbi:hypothetical protein OIU74_020734 [Salix koriyanagi]|uniref:Uncharacterized protein n=1 Tax=Salix koriyanagi TaxID=2511006 RepID=A0A9Q0P6K7_9ROSI|nr:hypothetical protein OIU74_020734 [Salix koriyanagi]